VAIPRSEVTVSRYHGITASWDDGPSQPSQPVPFPANENLLSLIAAAQTVGPAFAPTSAASCMQSVATCSIAPGSRRRRRDGLNSEPGQEASHPRPWVTGSLTYLT
jgi:hypothetical protein